MTDLHERMNPDVLDIRRERGIAWLTFTRPEALNSFDTRLQHAFRTAVDDVAADVGIRCVVITGAGRAFCAGADLSLDDLGPDVRLAPRTEEELRLRYNPAVKTIRTMPKPVIAAVNGAAVGVGCAIALSCDAVVAAESASFSVAFAKVGLTLDAGASLMLGARIGLGRTTRMAFDARSVDSSVAAEWGMVDEVVADDELIARANRLAQRYADGPTQAFAATKRSLNTALLPCLDAVFETEIAGQTALVDSADFREGVAAFMQRRTPTFTGSPAGPRTRM
ncbi:enoyl-CoA hydratase/isomerase family protein [Gordonia sp. NPDC003376]